jgi:hypothetical protein
MASGVLQTRGVAKINNACAFLCEADDTQALPKDVLPPLIQRLRAILDNWERFDRSAKLGILAANIRTVADRLGRSGRTVAERRAMVLLDKAADICSVES